MPNALADQDRSALRVECEDAQAPIVADRNPRQLVGAALEKRVAPRHEVVGRERNLVLLSVRTEDVPDESIARIGRQSPAVQRVEIGNGPKLLRHIFVAPKPLVEIENLPRPVTAKVRMGRIDGTMRLHTEEKSITQSGIVLELDA